ncbi:hypothetical protein BaRGS_00018735, partial [Batillaria attramentaria]
ETHHDSTSGAHDNRATTVAEQTDPAWRRRRLKRTIKRYGMAGSLWQKPCTELTVIEPGGDVEGGTERYGNLKL